MPSPKDEEVNHFLSNLAKTSGKPAILSLVKPYSSSYTPKALNEDLPLCLSLLQKNEYLQLNYGELLKVVKECSIVATYEQVQRVEENTRSQSKSSLWSSMRSGRVTASRFESAAHTDPANPSISLVMSVCHPELKKFQTAATCLGCEHEKAALEEYRILHTSRCKNGNVKVRII